MNTFDIRTMSGSEARPIVDPFYEKHEGRTRADDADIFFIATAIESEIGVRTGKILGTLRFCHEQGIPMLRGMLVDNDARHQGVGMALLDAFQKYLISRDIHEVLCLPFAPLEHFYQRIGFVRIDRREMPDFLILRLKGYLAAGNDCICMKRP